MIDLHSHILPALCDGSQNLETSIAMARLAVADGTTHLACTPHIYPGVYPNTKATIAPTLAALQAELDALEIPLTLVMGADVHMVPEVMEGLKTGRIPTLHGSRYFLLEPSHHVPVPHFLDQIENFLNAGYIPVITHPERLRWLDEHYQDFVSAARMGAWLQITAGAIAGKFGNNAKKLSERLLLDKVVHIIASDAHSIEHRPPILSEGVAEAIRITGDETEIRQMVEGRPQLVLNNAEPDSLPLPAGLLQQEFLPQKGKGKKNWFQQLFL
ncbi:CpsB/CapC family capsule biosynthesis tyrosine phosphatase [Candidatus Thiothrix sp. Deng01]|uniref:protein-tyrosine-phosphatase n=1 Tax=Candidatus Thiothrix phosphatis TaxID=3112415 RepID=A0ABU6D2M3_9GAMM|nr:CpsB/CapC family capsule biosynthesis tyrosine phosphatase [Candidatus Thiothrix sp. Deng01]MEB4593335.1 CpsB/CapC family capsule biosynthesis tyrosine phosphatase [Candidatus Thiothrix sp. Deng01]